jgi:regulatory protein
MRGPGRLTAVLGDDEGLLCLELDGEPWCRVEPMVVSRHGLEVGEIVPATVRRRVERAARDRSTVERAAAMLARRPYARADLERRLARRSGTTSARRALRRLDEVGALDDRRYATELAETRLRAGWGPFRIRHDLEQAGVGEEIIGETLESIDDAEWAAAEETAIGARTGVEAGRRLVARGFDPERAAERFADLDGER